MIKLKNINIAFKQIVIRNGEFQAQTGKLTGLAGKSGSGKSSIFNLVGLMTENLTCDYQFNGIHLNHATKFELNEIKKHEIAYLRQNCDFISDMNCIKNLEMVSHISGEDASKQRLLQLLEKVGLQNKAKVFPLSLSGGEKQRLAIAMALAKNAKLIICDEITSALDSENTNMIIDILKHLAHQNGCTVLLATHDLSVIKKCDDVYEIKNCELVKVKSSNLQSYSIIHPTTNHQTSFSFYAQMALKRFTRHPWMIGLLIFTSAITLSAIAFNVLLHHQENEYTKLKYQYSNLNEIVVTNQIGVVEKRASYNERNVPLTHSSLQEIQKQVGDSSVYPLYAGMFLNTIGKDLDANAKIKLYKDNTLIKEITVRQNEEYGFDFETNVIAYHPEQKFDELAIMKTNHANGIYLNEEAFRNMDLDELPDVMAFEVYLPVAYKHSSLQSGFIGGGNIGEMAEITGQPTVNLIYERVSIELEISGVLPYLVEEKALSSKSRLMIPYEVFEKYQHEAIANHEYQDDELSIQPSSLRIFVNENMDREQVIDHIRQENKNIEIDKSDLLETDITLFIPYLKVFNFSVISLFVIGLAMLYLYSLFETDDVVFLKLHGVQPRQQYLMIGIEIFFLSFLIGFVSYWLIKSLLESGIGWQRIPPVRRMYCPIDGFDIFITVTLLAILMSFMTEIRKIRLVRR